MKKSNNIKALGGSVQLDINSVSHVDSRSLFGGIVGFIEDSGLALVLDEHYISTSSEQEILESLSEHLEGLDSVEKFDFGKALGSLAKVGQSALPGAVRGASTGAVAGPWGALIGGLAGGALSAATKSGNKRPMTTTPAVPIQTSRPVTTARSAVPTQVPPTVQQPSTSNAGAAQLLSVLQQPQLLQAVASLVAGKYGRRQIPVGQTNAPPAAFLNLLSVLSQKASEEADCDERETTDAYLRSDEGEFVCDVASPTARAETLLNHLRESNTPEEPSETAEEWLLESGMAELEATDSLE